MPDTYNEEAFIVKKDKLKSILTDRVTTEIDTIPTYGAIKTFLEVSENRKIYVLDTNVLMADPDAMFKFEDNVVVIPDMVIEELDNHKKDAGDVGFNVRQAHRNFKTLRESGSLVYGVITDTDGLVIVMPSDTDTSTKMPPSWMQSKPDNIILAMAKTLQTVFDNIKVAIVSNDTNVQIKADEIGLKAEEYLHERVEEDYLSYSGRFEVSVTDAEFQQFKVSNAVDIELAPEIKENAFLIVRNKDTNGTLLGQAKNGQVVPLKYDNSNPFGVTPRNSGQRFAIEALMTPADDLPMVIMTGPAGTAKTFLTLACGLEKTMESNEYRRIVLTRANVEFDKSIGALPGDEETKIEPLLRGAIDNLELLVDEKGVKKGGKNGTSEEEISDKITELFERGYIKTEAMMYVRGRSVTRQFVFVDEAQNTSVSQMKGILTRPGDGTKLIISGDLDQIDNPKLDRHNNGLAYALKLMAGDPLCATVGFSEKESTRSKLAARVAEKIRQE